MNEELQRLQEDQARKKNWKRWGPYLAERQWATVREDYSAEGDPWDYFPHDQSRSRAYRWGEDGLLGITDRECRLCFALALWNEKDPILKERFFGLTNSEGNHGEDVKELCGCEFRPFRNPLHYMRQLDFRMSPAHAYRKATSDEQNDRKSSDDADSRSTLRARVHRIYLPAPIDAQAGAEV